MGKWSAIKDKFPRLEKERSEKPEYYQKVDAMKEKLLAMPDKDIAQAYREAYDAKEALEKKVKELNLVIEAANEILLNECEEKGVDKITYSGIGTFFQDIQPYAKFIPEEKKASIKWFEENGYEDAITVMHQTLNGVVKDRLEQGEDLPPGLDVHMKVSLKMRRS